jgi:hypothetical protein
MKQPTSKGCINGSHAAAQAMLHEFKITVK